MPGQVDLPIVFDNISNDPDAPRPVLVIKTPGQPMCRLNHGINPAVDAALDKLGPINGDPSP
jgi:hypothetical protein